MRLELSPRCRLWLLLLFCPLLAVSIRPAQVLYQQYYENNTAEGQRWVAYQKQIKRFEREWESLESKATRAKWTDAVLQNRLSELKRSAIYYQQAEGFSISSLPQHMRNLTEEERAWLEARDNLSDAMAKLNDDPDFVGEWEIKETLSYLYSQLMELNTDVPPTLNRIDRLGNRLASFQRGSISAAEYVQQAWSNDL